MTVCSISQGCLGLWRLTFINVLVLIRAKLDEKMLGKQSTPRAAAGLNLHTGNEPGAQTGSSVQLMESNRFVFGMLQALGMSCSVFLEVKKLQ